MQPAVLVPVVAGSLKTAHDCRPRSVLAGGEQMHSLRLANLIAGCGAAELC